MKNIKNTFLVSALSLGLIVGAVGVAGAATSTNYQQTIADWVKNDPNPMVMNMNTGATPVATPVINPVVTPVVTPAVPQVAPPATPPATPPVATQVVTPVVPPSTNKVTQQRQQTAPKQPTQNYNNGYNGNCWNGDRMSGNWSGNMGW